MSGLDQLGKGEKKLPDDILIGVAPVTGCFFMDGGVWMGRDIIVGARHAAAMLSQLRSR